MSAVNDLIGRIAVGIALGIVALVAAMTGLGFLFAALYMALTRVIDPDAAALAVGLAAFVTALIVLLISRRITRPTSPPTRLTRSARVQPVVGAPGGSAEAAAAEIGDLIAGKGRDLLHTHSMGATAAALIAGLALGVSPRLRRTLWRLLR